jgi:biotin synthase
MKDTAKKDLQQAADTGRPVSRETAGAVLAADAGDLPDILAAATAVRTRHFGNRINLCAITNARSGGCCEDCAFCAQSVHHNAAIDTYPLRNAAQIGSAYRESARHPVTHFGVVTSGPSVDAEELQAVCRAVREGAGSGPAWCASLGCLTAAQLQELKSAGLRRYHHNLETAESFFPMICTTHSYADRLLTLRAAKSAGLEVCSGGILGMGESLAQRVEFAEILAREDVTSIPLNFLVPIPETRLGCLAPMRPIEILKSVALFRLLNPRAEIRVCGGRLHLRDLQSMLFYAGATGMMIGPLLTVPGREVEEDLQMLRDLELEFGW